MSQNYHTRYPYKKIEISTVLKLVKKIQYTGDDFGDIFSDIDGVICFDSKDYYDFATFELDIN